MLIPEQTLLPYLKGKVTGANISVKLTDDFMNAALNFEQFTQSYPIYSENPTVTKNIDRLNIKFTNQ